MRNKNQFTIGLCAISGFTVAVERSTSWSNHQKRFLASFIRRIYSSLAVDLIIIRSGLKPQSYSRTNKKIDFQIIEYSMRLVFFAVPSLHSVHQTNEARTILIVFQAIDTHAMQWGSFAFHQYGEFYDWLI